MTCSRNDVILLPIPFTNLTSQKVRPAIVVGLSKADLFVVPVTSVLSNADLLLQDWKSAGLNVASGVKSQLATVESRLVLRIVGKLSNVDSVALDSQLRQWLQL